MRPASSSSTLTPAIASWNPAIPPAAPLPTTMTSQRSLPGLIESASRADSSSARVRLTLRVGSVCIMSSLKSDLSPVSPVATSEGLKPQLSKVFLPAVRAVLALFCLAADELAEELIALVPQFLVDADLRRVVAADGRLLGHHKEGLERGLGRALVAADLLEDGVDLTGAKPAERRTEPRRGFGVERRQAAEPLQRDLAVGLTEQQVDVVGHARLLRARRPIVGWNDRVNEHLEGLELRRREHLQLRRRIRLLDASERDQPFVGEPR